MDEARAIAILSEALKCEAVVSETAYEFTPPFADARIVASITKSRLSEIVSTLNAKAKRGSLWLHDDTSMEIYVREAGSTPARIHRGEIVIRDDDNGVTYEVGPASDEYFLFILGALYNQGDARALRIIHRSPSVERLLTKNNGQVGVFELLRTSFLLRISVVRIVCDVKTAASRMAELANGFLFQMAFNTDAALVPQKEIEWITRSGRISRMRRNRPSDIDPPRRTYNEDLIHHYLMAISTDNPFVEYLSHYHVLEHFYEAVFHDELISSIQGQLTDPSFSYRRRKDVKSLIATIRKSLKFQNDSITFSEEQALFLTLSRFVEIDGLVAEIESYDRTLLDYYRDNGVVFAGAKELDLRSADSAAIYKALSRRIYATRNALVHSKDGEKAKYTPFVDDPVLSKELPLLRFIAEKTILHNSSMID